jgi:hypothetical protein
VSENLFNKEKNIERKFLVVSGMQYSKTNRGIDIITSYLLSNDFIVDHLVFYVNKKKKYLNIENKNFRQLFFVDTLRIYRDKMKYIVPLFLIEFLFDIMIKKCLEINLNNYDYVILESGYPMFLAKYIQRDKIIFRQSDPLEAVFNTCRKCFSKLEERLYSYSSVIISVVESKFIPEKYHNKYYYWKTGYIENKNDVNISSEKKMQVTYMGLYKIDNKLINKLSKIYKDIKFNIIGNHKKIKNTNVYYHGYLSQEKYTKIILESICFLVPINKKNERKLKKFKITSKYFLPIEYGIPILTFSYGEIQNDIPEYKIFVYKNIKEAKEKFDIILETINNKGYDFCPSEKALIFINQYKLENVLKKLDDIFCDIIK